MGQNLSDVLTCDRPAAPLFRSNVRNFHPILGGLYGDLLYHHGAGSRRALFWGVPDPSWHEQVQSTLRDAALTTFPAS